MNSLILSISASPFLQSRSLYSLPIAFVVAESVYKFGSFTLECGAFLLTWFVLDAVGGTLLRRKAP